MLRTSLLTACRMRGESAFRMRSAMSAPASEEPLRNRRLGVGFCTAFDAKFVGRLRVEAAWAHQAPTLRALHSSPRTVFAQLAEWAHSLNKQHATLQPAAKIATRTDSLLPAVHLLFACCLYSLLGCCSLVVHLPLTCSETCSGFAHF